ncbi:DUF192 domain-containing protein [Thioclava sp. BHET1]|nr:DUF192 domain-containing protein [Thioclava sp. BHET1]
MIFLIMAGKAFALCAPDEVAFRTDRGVVQFAVELARTPAEREHGLMGRRQLAAGSGMLFIFDPPVHAVFWMKDTLIPLDMIFLDSRGRVLQVRADAKPLDERLIDGGEGVSFVLEINAGLAASRHIVPGAVMRSAEIGPGQAIWSCEAP